MANIPEEVSDLIAAVQPEKRQRDAGTLLELMSRATGEQPQRWGSIIGFGTYHYSYESGQKGDTCAAGFAPRKAATTIYLVDGIRQHEEALSRLGPHRTGVGCLYLTDLTKVDLGVLEEIITTSYSRVMGGTLPHRAREEKVTPG